MCLQLIYHLMYINRCYIKESIYRIPALICSKWVPMAHLLQVHYGRNKHWLILALIVLTKYGIITVEFTLPSLRHSKKPVKIILQYFECDLVKFGLNLYCLLRFYKFKLLL